MGLKSSPQAINMDFELSSEFSIIQAIPHFTIFGRFFLITRRWAGNTLSTKIGIKVVNTVFDSF